VGSTNDAFLRALYTDVLGRDIDPSGAASWTAALAQGQSRTAVAQQVLASAEADQDFVQAYYHQLLGRGADTGGLNSFVASLLAGARHDDVIVGFLASDEFFNRF